MFNEQQYVITYIKKQQNLLNSACSVNICVLIFIQQNKRYILMSNIDSHYKRYLKMTPNEFLHTIMLENGFPSKKAVADFLGVNKTRISAWNRLGKVPEKHIRLFAMEFAKKENIVEPTETDKNDNVVTPLLDKIEELTSELNEYKRAQESINMHESTWQHDFSCMTRIRMESFKMFRAVESIDSNTIKAMNKHLGYTKAEINNFIDIGVEYSNGNHPMFQMIDPSSAITLSNLQGTLWGMFKQKDGMFTLPLEIKFKHKTGKLVTAFTRNTINLKDKIVTTKVRFQK